MIHRIGNLEESKRSVTNVYQRINFDSSNSDRIDVGTVINGAKSISFFYTPNFNITSSLIGNVILSRYLGNNNDRLDMWFLYGKLNFQVRNSSGVVIVNISSNSNSWISGTKYHISINIDTNTSMYIDEVLQTSTNTNILAIPTSTKTLYLGGFHGLGIRYLNGSINNLQIWDIPRSTTERAIDKDTYYPNGTTGLIETYHFTDETGYVVTGVNANNGTIGTSSTLSYVNTVMREEIL